MTQITQNPETPKTAEQITNQKRAEIEACQRALRGANLDEIDTFDGWKTGRVITNQSGCDEDRAEYC
jgi:hypothetical protein